VFPIDDGRDSIEEDWLKEIIAKFEKYDDVFRTEFLSGVVFTAATAFSLSTGAGEFLRSEFGTSLIETMLSSESNVLPEPGPYLVHEGQFFSVWKLYDDTQGAFLTGLVPEENK
jgi:hypothetical protein